MRGLFVMLATCVGLALAGSFVGTPSESKPADKDFIARQEKIFMLFKHIHQLSDIEEVQKIAKDYSIESSIENYTNQKAVKEFWNLYEAGLLPSGKIFSVFYPQLREQAIALFHLFYYAKDFETFYKTAAWARQHVNEGMFVYAMTIAVLHREDTRGMVLPAPYEIYPYYFVNTEVINKAYRLKMQEGVFEPKVAEFYGITVDGNTYTIYSNYSGWYTQFNEEKQLSYFTEDIGLNSYYYYFHADYPFWMGGEEFNLKEDRRGELYYYFHQQLLARYYLERLTNGLGEIPQFSWKLPIKTGYNPSLQYQNGFKFPVRSDFYEIDTEENVYNVQFVKDFERMFRQYIDFGFFTLPNGDSIDLSKSESIETLGNWMQFNPDFFGGDRLAKMEYSYEIIARMLLGASEEPTSKYYVGPSALEQFETSLRDPAFWQLYSRITQYFIYFKQHLAPYTKEELYFDGVKIEDVQVDKELYTFFDYFDHDINNAVFFSKEELVKTADPFTFKVRRPRLDHNEFSLKIKINSEKEHESVVRIFLGPKYDSYGRVLSYDDNKYSFVEVDTFLYKLTKGENLIERNSKEFFRVVKDRTDAYKLHAEFNSGTFDLDNSEAHFGFPERLLLPKGTKGGFPFQFFVVVSPYMKPSKVFGAEFDEDVWSGVGTGARYLDARAFGYPLDRPIVDAYFYQPNMFHKDVLIYHKGDDCVYNYAKPEAYEFYSNKVEYKH